MPLGLSLHFVLFCVFDLSSVSDIVNRVGFVTRGSTTFWLCGIRQVINPFEPHTIK